MILFHVPMNLSISSRTSSQLWASTPPISLHYLVLNYFFYLINNITYTNLITYLIYHIIYNIITLRSRCSHIWEGSVSFFQGSVIRLQPNRVSWPDHWPNLLSRAPTALPSRWECKCSSQSWSDHSQCFR